MPREHRVDSVLRAMGPCRSGSIVSQLPRVQRRRSRGYTILELVIVITIAAIVLAISVPRVVWMLDRVSVEAAVSDVISVLASARALALAGRTSVAVDVDSLAGVLRVRRGSEALQTRNISDVHGVTLRSTRDSLSYDPYGLGHGAANLSIIVRRGSAVDTVFVSRFGRVR